MNAHDTDCRQSRPNRDLYTVLGLPRDALSSDIQAAYRRLAREWHPDLNRGEGAVAEFMLINEAYSTLSNPIRRSAYDYSLRSCSNPAHNQLRSPVRCAECGRSTAQPRVIVVRASVGLGLWSYVRKAEGLYCSTCARRAATRASMASAALGWWAVPFGPFVTIWCIWSNAFMGQQRHPADRRLALINAYAFLQREDFRLAHALARQALTGADRLIAAEAQDILRQAETRGTEQSALALHNPWRPSLPYLGLHGLLCVVPPMAVVMTLVLLLAH